MIELTVAQAQALAQLAQREGTLVLHQLAGPHSYHETDAVYATPHGTITGFRIDRDGSVSTAGESLPAPD